MSKYMQLTVTVQPYYQKDLEATYPNLTHYLKFLDPSLTEQSPALYGLAGQLDKLLYRLEGTPLRKVLLRHAEKLRSLHKRIEEKIADWKLAEADKLLYSIEDIFDEVEADPELDIN